MHLHNIQMYFFFLSCTWSHTSEAIVMHRQQQPAGGKESAPAPNPSSGEKHSVRVQRVSLQNRGSAASSPSHPHPASLSFLSPSFFLSFLICMLKPQRQAAACWTCTWTNLQMSVCVSFVARNVWVCLFVLKTTPLAEMRNPNHSPPLINCLARFTSHFLHSHSHLFLYISLCSLEVSFFSYLLFLPWFFVQLVLIISPPLTFISLSSQTPRE